MRTAALLTAEDFARVAPVLGPCELVKGEVIPMSHQFGVDLVWVLDPQTLSLRAYARGASPVLLRDSDTASVDPHVPGFAVRVRQFFED